MSNPNRKFMEMAIEEMKKSRSEHTDKTDPLVGAILVNSDGEILGKSYRGGLRVGDHAEYTLIERNLGDKSLEGTTLFVTLEPCTQRNIPKKSCAERIISARISKVYIGTLDPNPKIQGQGLTKLQSNGVEVAFFDLDLFHQIREENQNFIKQFNFEDINIEGDSSDISFSPSKEEKKPILSATIYDFSNEVIQLYLDAREETFTIPSKELWNYFYQNEFLLKESNNGDNWIPTVAGILLFGEKPENFLTQSIIKIESRQGSSVIAEDLTGPLLTLPEKIEDFLNRNMRTYVEIVGLKRIEKPEYPIEALREGLFNAISHRDYSEGSRIIIQILPNEIVIKNPGLPLPPLSLDDIQNYNAQPYSRNPRIAGALSSLGYMEERGWGLSLMRDKLLENGLRPPQFTYESGYFVVKFLGRERKPIKLGTKPLHADHLQIISYINERGSITSKECADLCKISIATARRYLKYLILDGIITKREKGRATYYVLQQNDS